MDFENNLPGLLIKDQRDDLKRFTAGVFQPVALSGRRVGYVAGINSGYRPVIVEFTHPAENVIGFRFTRMHVVTDRTAGLQRGVGKHAPLLVQLVFVV